VYSSITLQHMAPQLAESYIREFFRIARPGAHVIFQLPSRPRSAVWHGMKRIMPVNLSNMLWRARTRNPEAMESYFMPERRVRTLVEQSNASIAFVESDRCGPPGWQSLKYFCIRQS
jgi:predicted ATP-grasp superfamily ATP-dependent carboligase